MEYTNGACCLMVFFTALVGICVPRGPRHCRKAASLNGNSGQWGGQALTVAGQVNHEGRGYGTFFRSRFASVLGFLADGVLFAILVAVIILKSVQFELVSAYVGA